jgi:hypothetical protein
MNRPTQIRDVFRELRAVLGSGVSAREILECAALIVDVASDPAKEPEYDTVEGRLPFSQWALDMAIADGGWRVLYHETDLSQETEDEERIERRYHNGMVRLATGMVT